MDKKPVVYIEVKLNEDEDIAIVRKLVIGDDGRVNGVYGLTREGKWIEKAEGTRYAPECMIPGYNYTPSQAEAWLEGYKGSREGKEWYE